MQLFSPKSTSQTLDCQIQVKSKKLCEKFALVVQVLFDFELVKCIYFLHSIKRYILI